MTNHRQPGSTTNDQWPACQISPADTVTVQFSRSRTDLTVQSRNIVYMDAVQQ